MTVMDYFGLVLGVFMLVLGLPSFLGLSQTVSRNRSWFFVLAGAGVLLSVAFNYNKVPRDSWVHWTVTVLVLIGFVLYVKGRPRRS